jgi:hypothetical protein
MLRLWITVVGRLEWFRLDDVRDVGGRLEFLLEGVLVVRDEGCGGEEDADDEGGEVRPAGDGGMHDEDDDVWVLHQRSERKVS